MNEMLELAGFIIVLSTIIIVFIGLIVIPIIVALSYGIEYLLLGLVTYPLVIILFKILVRTK